MDIHTFSLFPYEYEALLESLRRDLSSELHKANTKPEWGAHHRFNARETMRLLEAINPKSTSSASGSLVEGGHRKVCAIPALFQQGRISETELG